MLTSYRPHMISVCPRLRVHISLRLRSGSMFSKSYLGDLIGTGKGIDHLSMFTMAKDYERDDNCAQIYRKSLLYLIHYALEPEVEAPILGLEQSLREDPRLQAIFGLDSTPGAVAEVIFSVTPIDKGKSASTSTTHGGFDDDAPTMNSVARRILGKADADAIEEYKSERSAARGADLWQNQVDWPERVSEPVVAGRVANHARIVVSNAAPDSRALSEADGNAPCASASMTTRPRRSPAAWPTLKNGRGHSRGWVSKPRFCPTVKRARSAIIERWRDLIATSAPGDVLALQFAGHGTQLPDLNGDEEDNSDEAICPYDFADGAFLIDDDIRELFSKIPDGVNVTCFFDCCHSGTATRLRRWRGV